MALGWLFDRLRPPATPAEAIERLRARHSGDIAAHVYADGRRFIVTALRSRARSGSYETGTPEVLDASVDDAALGAVVLACLLAHVDRPPPNLRGTTIADWAAYRASGARSGKSFAASHVLVSVTAGSDGLALDAHLTRGGSGTLAAGVAPVEPAALGAALRRVVAEALKKRPKSGLGQ